MGRVLRSPRAARCGARSRLGRAAAPVGVEALDGEVEATRAERAARAPCSPPRGARVEAAAGELFDAQRAHAAGLQRHRAPPAASTSPPAGKAGTRRLSRPAVPLELRPWPPGWMRTTIARCATPAFYARRPRAARGGRMRRRRRAEEVAPPYRRRAAARPHASAAALALVFGVDAAAAVVGSAVVRLDGGDQGAAGTAARILERLPVVPSADANAPEELGGWFRPIVERLAMDVAALCEAPRRRRLRALYFRPSTLRRCDEPVAPSLTLSKPRASWSRGYRAPTTPHPQRVDDRRADHRPPRERLSRRARSPQQPVEHRRLCSRRRRRPTRSSTRWELPGASTTRLSIMLPRRSPHSSGTIDEGWRGCRSSLEPHRPHRGGRHGAAARRAIEDRIGVHERWRAQESCCARSSTPGDRGAAAADAAGPTRARLALKRRRPATRRRASSGSSTTFATGICWLCRPGLTPGVEALDGEVEATRAERAARRAPPRPRRRVEAAAGEF